MVAGGTRGDVEPLTEIVRGLTEAGHSVRFVTDALYRDSIENCGAEWVDNGGPDPRTIIAAEAAGSRQWTRPPNRLRRLIYGWKHMGPSLDALRWVSAQVKGSDVVLYNPMCSPAYIAAQGAGLPAILLSVSTRQPSREHSKPVGPIFQHRHRLPAAYNLAVPWLFGVFDWSADRKWLRPWCAELGIPSPGLHEWVVQPRAPGLFGFSPHLLRRPADWPTNREVTGFWFSEETRRRAASALERRSGQVPRKVYLYFGSNAVGEDRVIRDVILPVLQELKLELIEGSHGSGEGGRRVDYRDLLSEADIVIHHGGVGTSGLVAQFGCAHVIVPAFGEQRFWAARMELAGLCPRVIPRSELDRDGFRAAMQAVMRDAGFATRARNFGKLLLSENGTEKATQRVLEMAASACADRSKGSNGIRA
jgi:sterol 3beta-glucosyltransferase